MPFRFIIVFAIFLGFSCSQKYQKSSLSENELVFESLRCNSKINPMAIEDEQPLFSWIVNAEGFNKSQSAYHIIVASSLEKLNEN